MTTMLAGTHVKHRQCYCHSCMCCGSNSYTNYDINHTKRSAKRREKDFWKKDQRENAA